MPALAAASGLSNWRCGWQVTAVEIVEKALQRARERVHRAGVEVELVRGDATALRASEIGSGYRLVLDTGTFHGFEIAPFNGH